MQDLSVGLGDTLELVLLLDGVAVGGSLGGIDQLIGQALGDGLDVPEGGLPSSSAEQPDCL